MRKGQMVDDNLQKQMVFEANRKSVGITYLLWLFLGAFGVHRFYAGDTQGGIIQLVLCLSIVGWIVLAPWLLVDLFLIPGVVRKRNMETINMLTMGSKQPAAAPAPNPELEGRQAPLRNPERRQVRTEADRKREAMLDELKTIGYKKDRRDRSLYR